MEPDNVSTLEADPRTAEEHGGAIAFVGGGQMARALIAGLVRSGCRSSVSRR